MLMLLIAVIGLSSCTPKGDCGFVKNMDNERISWKSSLPIKLRLHTSFPRNYISALEAAMEVWNKEAGTQLFSLDKSSEVFGPADAKKDGVNVIYFYSKWEREKAFEQARTSVYWKGERIEEADVRINAADFTFLPNKDSISLASSLKISSGSSLQPSENSLTSPVSGVHFESLLVHELGHVLGMKHNDQQPSVMATFLQNNAVRVALTSNDKNSLSCEY